MNHGNIYYKVTKTKTAYNDAFAKCQEKRKSSEIAYATTKEEFLHLAEVLKSSNFNSAWIGLSKCKVRLKAPSSAPLISKIQQRQRCPKCKDVSCGLES